MVLLIPYVQHDRPAVLLEKIESTRMHEHHNYVQKNNLTVYNTV